MRETKPLSTVVNCGRAISTYERHDRKTREQNCHREQVTVGLSTVFYGHLRVQLWSKLTPEQSRQTVLGQWSLEPKLEPIGPRIEESLKLQRTTCQIFMWRLSSDTSIPLIPYHGQVNLSCLSSSYLSSAPLHCAHLVSAFHHPPQLSLQMPRFGNTTSKTVNWAV